MDTGTHLAADSRAAGRPPHSSLRAAACAAAGWATAFSLIHLYWLLGGRIGLPAGLAVRDNTPLLVINVLSIPLCAVAAVLALALVRPWGARLPAGLLTVGARGTAALLLLHAAPSVPDWVALAAGARTTSDLDAMGRFATFLYEPFFMAGGLLFALASLAVRGQFRFARFGKSRSGA
ncbi:DUF3995 domain-containing protein [Streptomyces bungoensis]|uniref:DUF3995 domain-containing protein n=1 Tax=Streptomyces bungoensis TaxID=285568 RepID=UPI00343C18A0